MIHLLLVLALIGFLTWLIITYIPMPDIFKKVIVVIVVIVLIFYVLNLFGFSDIPLR